MGARGRVAMLGELAEKRLAPTSGLSDRIFSCILCEACKNLCPTGINIPEVIYHGRTRLKKSYSKGRFLSTALKFSSRRMDAAFFILRSLQKLFYQPLYKTGRLRYVPPITSKPFKNGFQFYKFRSGNLRKIKKIGRIAIFTGCNINYFYPELGDALLNILLTKGYEIVVFKGEVCCGAPMRSLGLEQEALSLAKKNIELFNKTRVEAILSMCPTCTMVIKHQYPILIGDSRNGTGNSITNILDVNEFFIKYDIAKGLKITPRAVTYHDPCHLRYGMGVKTEPREILKDIQGIKLVEMEDADKCCGFGGLFSLSFKDLSKSIGRKKIDNIYNTSADTVVTSCPGCMTQLEDLKRETNTNINIMHIVEVLDEAMHE